MHARIRCYPLGALFALLAFTSNAAATPALTAAEEARVRAVVGANAALLGARDVEFCGVNDASCRAEMDAATTTRIDSPPLVLEVEAAPRAGREWPGQTRLSDARRIIAEVNFSRAGRTARREVPLLSFQLGDGKRRSACVFPLEHWEWSGMRLPQRFAMAPMGICGERLLSVADLLAESRAPGSAPWAIRFLSEAEAQRWEAGDVEALRHDTGWNPAHPFAKYFFLESMRWWRAGGTQPTPDHAAAIRLPRVPLEEVRRLSRSGDAFLDFYDDGEQVELTIVTRTGLQHALRWPWESLRDRSPLEASAPRFETAATSSAATASP